MSKMRQVLNTLEEKARERKCSRSQRTDVIVIGRLIGRVTLIECRLVARYHVSKTADVISGRPNCLNELTYLWVYDAATFKTTLDDTFDKLFADNQMERTKKVYCASEIASLFPGPPWKIRGQEEGSDEQEGMPTLEGDGGVIP